MGFLRRKGRRKGCVLVTIGTFSLSLVYLLANVTWSDAVGESYSSVLAGYFPQFPMNIVIVSYQRTGSSFLFELFNQNPRAFTWFEPLDGLYSAIYGTQFGYNVPADIWNNMDGSDRSLPEFEVQAQLDVMHSILTCNFTSLPTEVLLHKFLKMFKGVQKRLAPYLECVDPHVNSTLTKFMRCNQELSDVCPKRFGADMVLSRQCATQLWKLESENQASPDYTEQISTAVQQYQICREEARQEALACTHHLESACANADIRVIKPVRLRMRDAHRLPVRAHLLHNVRDPRGVVWSRLRTSTAFHSLHAGSDVTKEAMLYCKNVADDIFDRQKLFKHSLTPPLQVIYEEYATDPVGIASEIYNYLSLPLPNNVTRWLKKNTSRYQAKQTTRNSKQTAWRWRRILKPLQVMRINEVCRNLYSHVGYAFR